MLKLPYQILQAVVGAVAGMVLCWKCGIHKLLTVFSREFRQADRHQSCGWMPCAGRQIVTV